ncbi:hypothetical protein TIFTF001_032993 [Ficus carica]|uniref:Uncharacterized protein n=1 Tax=Ficus carica TaxID=3494 RepID=A0AA88DY72_FICCA|nr:hypothetical protein TIFTF001_032993 [Ficus carica]
MQTPLRRYLKLVRSNLQQKHWFEVAYGIRLRAQRRPQVPPDGHPNFLAHNEYSAWGFGRGIRTPNSTASTVTAIVGGIEWALLAIDLHFSFLCLDLTSTKKNVR